MSRSKIPMLGGAPVENPYEIRSDSGLEGVFADPDDAEFHAAELRREGVQNVVVEKRRRPSYADRSQAARALRSAPQQTEAPIEELGEPMTHELRNPSDRLFAGVYPTGIVYADRAQEVDGDYKRIARLPYASLRLQWEPGHIPAELRAEVEADAAAIIARRGQPFEISSSGQTVILGGGAARPAGAPPQYHTPQGRPPGVPNAGPRVLREKWGDSSEIVVERQRYGISAWLESKRGGGRVPVSFGAEHPETLREAMELAKKFLRGVYGKTNPAGADRGALMNVFLVEQQNGWHVDAHYQNARMDYGPFATKDLGAQMREAVIESALQCNPAGLTAKGERMYEDIKHGYEERGEPRAKEIASRTVAARAKEIPGLKKRRR